MRKEEKVDVGRAKKDGRTVLRSLTLQYGNP